jgi:hypothetical protein
MPAPIKTVIMVVVVLFLCVWLLSIAGLLGGGPYFGSGTALHR